MGWMLLTFIAPPAPAYQQVIRPVGAGGRCRRPKPVLIVGALIEHVIAKSRRIRSEIVEYIYILYLIFRVKFR